jgi:hypothetical protein
MFKVPGSKFQVSIKCYYYDCLIKHGALNFEPGTLNLKNQVSDRSAKITKHGD